MITLQHEFPSLSLRQLCTLLDVSRSWFYQRPHQPTQAERDLALRDAIERIVLELPGYGYRRVTAELRRQHYQVNHKRVLRIMRSESLLCQLQRSWTTTTDSRHGLQTYPNLLGRIRKGWPIACCNGQYEDTSRRPDQPTVGTVGAVAATEKTENGPDQQRPS